MGNLLYLTPLAGHGVPWANSKSIQFTAASSQYITLGNNVSDNFNNAFSWSFYVKFPSSLPSSQASIIAKVEGSPNYRGYVIDILSTGQVDFLLINTYSTNTLFVSSPAGVITVGPWYFITVTTDGTGTAAGTRIYVNGVSQALTITFNNLSATTTNTQALLFGADNEGILEDFLNGNLAQVAHWTTALSAANVTALYNSGTPVNPLAQSFAASCNHFWPLGTPSDSIAANGILDRVGVVNGTPTNGPTISSSHP